MPPPPHATWQTNERQHCDARIFFALHMYPFSLTIKLLQKTNTLVCSCSVLHTVRKRYKHATGVSTKCGLTFVQPLRICIFACLFSCRKTSILQKTRPEQATARLCVCVRGMNNDMGRGGVDIGSPLRAESADSGFSEQSESESESSFPGDHLALENEPHRGNLIPTATNTSATRSQQQQQQHARKKTEEANEGISRSPNGSKPARSYEMKKVVEKKFRTRYRSLQEAYENRLHALALQVQHAVNQIQNDTTVFCLQENPLTSEFATIRLGEIVQECFFGEREKYIKVVSDQVAWQASDLRDAQRKLRAVRQREKEMQQRWTQSQRAIQVLQQQLHGQKRIAAQQEEMHHAVRAEKEGIQVELERMKLNVHSFETLQKEYETLQLRTQNERDKEQSAQEQYAKLMQEMESLKAVSVVREVSVRDFELLLFRADALDSCMCE